MTTRTTARSALCLLFAATGLLLPVAAAAAVPRLIFPVVGPASYTNDFGAPRGSGRHAGVDIMAPKRALAVAAEAGTVAFWTTSARAGCMLYLRGVSGTTYLYVHLNNDRTRGNDNRGGCAPGVAYAPGLRSGDRVEAGEPIGYVGDSGDADGIASHLHFEVHPGGGGPVSPYPHLRRARTLLFAPAPGRDVFRLALRGTVVDVQPSSIELAVDRLRRYPGGLTLTGLERTVELALSPETTVFDPLGAVIAGAQLARAAPGRAATVWTPTQETSLPAQLGAPLALAAQRISLAG